MKWFRTLLLLCGVVALIAALSRTSDATQIGAPNPALFAGCNQSALFDASSSGMTRIVVGNATQQIYPCGYVILQSAGSVNVDFVYGTGGACATGTTKITPAFELTTSIGGVVDHLPVYTGLPIAPVNNDVCINLSSGVAVQAIFYYAQF
jgi:hypothetical protein